MKRFLATILTVFTLFSMAAMPVTAFASGPDDNGVSVISSDYLSSYNVYVTIGRGQMLSMYLSTVYQGKGLPN